MIRKNLSEGLAGNYVRYFALICLFLFCGSLSPAVQHKEQIQPEQGVVVQYSSVRLDLKVDSSRGPITKTFAIATTAKIVDDVHPRDRVKISYVERPPQLLVVSMQRLPDIDFDGPPGKSDGGYLGVSELIVPPAEAARIMAKVGPDIEPRGRDWDPRLQTGGGGPGGGGGPEQKTGTIVSIRRVNSVESEMVVNLDEKSYPSRPTTYVLDLITHISGRLRKGVRVTITSEQENDRRYALDVIAKTERR